MPVHWYYDVPRIKQDFKGWIKQYERPKDSHPTSILRLSNTGIKDRTLNLFFSQKLKLLKFNYSNSNAG